MSGGWQYIDIKILKRTLNSLQSFNTFFHILFSKVSGIFKRGMLGKILRGMQ